MLAAPDDHEALVLAIERLLADSRFLDKIIPAARRRAEDIFDNRTLIERLPRTYADNEIQKNKMKPKEFA
ncbi:glycosyltransferase [Desulfovibrio ferrophilus]|uniref:Glycosyl transferase group 1 n=1 Tax=Desulfovibrio ferrophilus TaxID=241368 RepID=A0A2Z6AYA9_9BACT|nr:hypothetical protein [Desulfovibrio ferrophilus]BBD08180.1 glycosyl transferase group 1 [Desulfovibrio ferrophilus]